jgi:hypothetical protein
LGRAKDCGGFHGIHEVIVDLRISGSARVLFIFRMAFLVSMAHIRPHRNLLNSAGGGASLAALLRSRQRK